MGAIFNKGAREIVYKFSLTFVQGINNVFLTEYTLFTAKKKMNSNIPAYAAPTLCIGRTYDARNVSVGIDIFPSNIPTEKIKKMNVNYFTFKYKVVRNSNDVKDLLDITGELSLKVKAGLVKVEGSGKYLTDTDKKEKTTELLAVLKCVTVSKG